MRSFGVKMYPYVTDMVTKEITKILPCLGSDSCLPSSYFWSSNLKCTDILIWYVDSSVPGPCSLLSLVYFSRKLTIKSSACASSFLIKLTFWRLTMTGTSFPSICKIDQSVGIWGSYQTLKPVNVKLYYIGTSCFFLSLNLFFSSEAHSKLSTVSFNALTWEEMR